MLCMTSLDQVLVLAIDETVITKRRRDIAGGPRQGKRKAYRDQNHLVILLLRFFLLNKTDKFYIS